MIIILAGLLLGAPAQDHRVTLTHAGQPVAATYQARVSVEHKQIGSAAPGGRPSTLRCAWKAAVTVERQAVRGDGIASARTLAAEPITGSHPGWCEAQRAAIADAVAQRGDAVRARLMAAAAEDHATIVADLDAAHGRRTG
jgi:hypothetical protein